MTRHPIPPSNPQENRKEEWRQKVLFPLIEIDKLMSNSSKFNNHLCQQLLFIIVNIFFHYSVITQWEITKMIQKEKCDVTGTNFSTKRDKNLFSGYTASLAILLG